MELTKNTKRGVHGELKKDTQTSLFLPYDEIESTVWTFVTFARTVLFQLPILFSLNVGGQGHVYNLDLGRDKGFLCDPTPLSFLL